MRNRAFGVEIECNFRNITSDSYAQRDHARKVLRSAKVSSDWIDNIGFDGSGIEVRSPILSGPLGFKELGIVMNKFHENGGSTNAHDGMHVHHDAPEYIEDRELAAKLVRSWMANEPLIHKFVHSRRVGSWACPSNWTEARVQEMLKGISDDPYFRDIDPENKKVFSPIGRGALNLNSLQEHGTIEIRLHEGTLDFEKAFAWIRFGQALLNNVPKRKRPLKPVTGSHELLKSLRVTKGPAKKLLATARA
jgi:hypothetical protein